MFSYAVIGPLHYLTEINWLHNRRFFATSQMDYWLMFSIGLFLCMYVVEGYKNLVNVLFFMAFFYGLGIMLLQRISHRMLLVAAAFVLGYVFQKTPLIMLVFGILLPTLIHVFLFTGLFILHGALRSRSLLGVLSLVAFVGCAVSFLVWEPTWSYKASAYAEQALINSGFVNLNGALLYHFDRGPSNHIPCSSRVSA